MAELIIKNLEDRLSDLKDDCHDMGNSIQAVENSRHQWMFINKDALTSLDSTEVHDFFTRVDAEELYEEAMTSSDGTNHTCAMATNQSDILSGLERDFRQRHRSRIRMIAHEANNKASMGSDRGVIQKGILDWLQDEALRQSADPAAGQ